MMDTVLVPKILVRVVHVLAGIDVEVLLLGVLDLEHVSLDVVRVLSEICANDRGVVITRHADECSLV